MIYIQITQFAEDAGDELKELLVAFRNEQAAGGSVDGIILDLRNNPGGFLQEALRVVNQFLHEDDIILHERDAEGNISSYRAHGLGLATDIPMVVLVNEGSASAAEITAGALQKNERAKLVGETTLGTGTVLRPFNLSDGSVIRLGVTNWLTPNYELIKDEGIRPDVFIEQAASVEMIDSFALERMSRQDLYAHQDRQFNSALVLLRLMVRSDADGPTYPMVP
jgi:carboxyl-terminal processing protease